MNDLKFVTLGLSFGSIILFLKNWYKLGLKLKQIFAKPKPKLKKLAKAKASVDS